MTRPLFLLVCMTTISLLIGCAGTSSRPDVAASHPHAECLVCKHNADLACVDVEVEQDTPTYAYNGKTYYFCSNACRNHFATEPVKYLGE